jgi:hypothetical protein
MKNEEVVKAKPCPFCNSRSILIYQAYIECMECGAMGPNRTDGESKTAIELWNTRRDWGQ